MFIKKKQIVNEGPFTKLKIEVLASDKTECQIQVETKYDDFFFDLSVEAALSLRDFLTEFTCKQNEIKDYILEFSKWKDLNFFESERHLNRPVIYVSYNQKDSKEYSVEQLFDKFMLERNK